MQHVLRTFWQKIFAFNWKFGLLLIVIVCVPRFILVLYANTTGNYGSIGIIMLVSALAPFIFLNKYGRQKIGIKKPGNYSWLLAAFAAGIAFSLLLYFLGTNLYDDSYANWYKYIGKSYKIPSDISPGDRSTLFTVVAITGMIFSPFGEELFFRGIVHSAFAVSLGNRKASMADGSAFALTHISHFGLVFISGSWSLFVMPTVLWVLSMFVASIMFFFFKKSSGSIMGAIVCHAGFNLGMTYSIFYLL
ncbi:lysostaphin resistance A-like protein [Flavitalea sp.]|nr:CPBP family glutamic-type intramembrane protease [Flavitalea sp.]